MKILIDKKVWDLPNGVLTDVRDMMRCTVLGRVKTKKITNWNEVENEK